MEKTIIEDLVYFSNWAAQQSNTETINASRSKKLFQRRVQIVNENIYQLVNYHSNSATFSNNTFQVHDTTMSTSHVTLRPGQTGGPCSTDLYRLLQLKLLLLRLFHNASTHTPSAACIILAIPCTCIYVMISSITFPRRRSTRISSIRSL